MQSAECCTSVLSRICAGTMQLGAGVPFEPLDAVGAVLKVVQVWLHFAEGADSS